MNNLRRIGNEMRISIPADEDGFTGRECPVADCLGQFKVQLGTGLKGKDLPCHCPYCGHVEGHNKFFTPAQIEYAKSVALNRITDAILKDFKDLEFDHRPSGGFGIGVSMKVEGRPTPIRRYREKKLETVVICNHCTLRYAIYGVFAFCPDCGEHNSLQILTKNLEVVEKLLALAATLDRELAEQMVGDALENAVSAFDGFGRELMRLYAAKSTNPERAEKQSFQNLASANDAVKQLFTFDMSTAVEPKDWDFALRCFQKRHLLAHKSGVIDEDYVRKTGDTAAIVGRKIVVVGDEVKTLVGIVKNLGNLLVNELQKNKNSTPCT